MSAQARMDLRLPKGAKAVVEKAAALRGLSMSAYVIEAASRQAEKDISASEVIRFSAEESRELVATLAQPFQPNEKLSRALERHEAEGL